MSHIARLHSVKDATSNLRLSRSKVYEEINSGRLKSVKVGRRRLIQESALIDYIDNLIKTAAPGAGCDVTRDAVVVADVVQPSAVVVRQ
jgi:excisionase family DNA binding protein